MKDHIRNDHEHNQQISVEHYKMSRNCNSEVSITVHNGKDLWKMNNEISKSENLNLKHDHRNTRW